MLQVASRWGRIVYGTTLCIVSRVLLLLDLAFRNYGACNLHGRDNKAAQLCDTSTYCFIEACSSSMLVTLHLLLWRPQIIMKWLSMWDLPNRTLDILRSAENCEGFHRKYAFVVRFVVRIPARPPDAHATSSESMSIWPVNAENVGGSRPLTNKVDVLLAGFSAEYDLVGTVACRDDAH